MLNEPTAPDARELIHDALNSKPRRDAALATLAAIAVELRLSGYETGRLAEEKTGASDSAISRARIRIAETRQRQKRLAQLYAGTR